MLRRQACERLSEGLRQAFTPDLFRRQAFIDYGGGG